MHVREGTVLVGGHAVEGSEVPHQAERKETTKDARRDGELQPLQREARGSCFGLTLSNLEVCSGNEAAQVCWLKF